MERTDLIIVFAEKNPSFSCSTIFLFAVQQGFCLMKKAEQHDSWNYIQASICVLVAYLKTVYAVHKHKI